LQHGSSRREIRRGHYKRRQARRPGQQNRARFDNRPDPLRRYVVRPQQFPARFGVFDFVPVRLRNRKARFRILEVDRHRIRRRPFPVDQPAENGDRVVFVPLPTLAAIDSDRQSRRLPFDDSFRGNAEDFRQLTLIAAQG
jgi:hypothetical protein